MTAGPLYRRLAETASKNPQSIALTFLRSTKGAASTYSYGELFERVESLAAQLASVYDDNTAPLGLLLASQEDQVLHYLAALSVGVVPAILTPPNRKLNHDYYVETTSAVLGRCKFGAVVSDVPGMKLSAPTLEPFTFSHTQGSPALPEPGATDATSLGASFLQFSSGTTGIKKGVCVDDNAMIAQLEAYGDALDLSSADCIVSWLPLYHDMGFIACLNMPLAHGAHSVMIDPIDWVSNPTSYLEAVSAYRGTWSWHPNFAFSFMARTAREKSLEDVDLSSMRGLVNCSEPATHKSQQDFLDRFGKYGLSSNVFKGCYAMAETTFALTHGEPDDPMNLDPVGPVHGSQVPLPVVSVGRPLPGVELAIMGSDGVMALPEREIGDIWVKSPFNFFAYYNDDDATDDVVVGSWYRTGDLGYQVGGAYYVVGRKKDMLIVAGVNVFPHDIEDLVSDVAGIHKGRVSAFSSFDEQLQTERVVVIAESNETAVHAKQHLTQEVRQKILAAFQIANFEVSFVEPGWLVKSSSGKMARGANRAKWLKAQSEQGMQ